ncbi:MAG: hypothetical protein HDR88_16095 [Bacteroides sp.]|nr:hypothetical protein [Bacteroides sp.]
MKQFYTFMLTAFGVFSANADWAPTSLPWIDGLGTPDSPYKVSTVTHLTELSREVAEGETFSEAIFELTNNIDCEGATIPAIGVLDKYTVEGEAHDESRYFKGTFYGNYNIIDNFNLTDAHVPEENKESIGGTGLFACATHGTWIDGLIIGEKATINGGLVTGGFIGQMNGGWLINCMMLGTVNATEFSGGLVGVMEEGLVSGCIHAGEMNGTTDVGGIVGQQAGDSRVEVCYNKGTVIASGFGGAGITGAMYDNSLIAYCYNIGTIQGESNPWLGEPDGLTADMGPNNTVISGYNVEELSGVMTRFGENLTPQELCDFPEGLHVPLVDMMLPYGDIFFVKDTEDINNGFPVINWENWFVNHPTGITVIEPNENNALHYYDLTGREIKHPTKGVVVIERRGNATRKVIL